VSGARGTMRYRGQASIDTPGMAVEHRSAGAQNPRSGVIWRAQNGSYSAAGYPPEVGCTVTRYRLVGPCGYETRIVVVPILRPVT
jgi:hypothetical protein